MDNNIKRPMVAGNWKMNGNNALVDSFSSNLITPSNVDVVICPPACFIGHFASDNFKLGAQNVSHLDNGAHTGELSCSILKEVGVSHIIVGHSERREGHAETNQQIGLKVKAVLDADLTPILCVGEPLEVREDGNVFAFVKAQLDAVLAVCSESYIENTVIAYEPIWAIGTGKTATPEQAQEVHAFIRQELNAINAKAANKARILYGGSVNAGNAHILFGQKDIDGGLIGGASLKIEDFTTICQAAG